MGSDIHTLTGAYAVDALPEDERLAFEAHLAACEACSVEVAELQATAARLGAASPVVAPPGLRAAVLGEIADTPRDGRARRRDDGRSTG